MQLVNYYLFSFLPILSVDKRWAAVQVSGKVHGKRHERKLPQFGHSTRFCWHSKISFWIQSMTQYWPLRFVQKLLYRPSTKGSKENRVTSFTRSISQLVQRTCPCSLFWLKGTHLFEIVRGSYLRDLFLYSKLCDQVCEVFRLRKLNTLF